jgi:hypothetical protein
LAVTAVAASSFADLKAVVQMQISMNGDFRPMEYSTVYYKGNLIRIDSKNKSMISNSKTHKMIILDHLKRTYSVEDTDLAGEASDTMKMFSPKLTAKVTPTGEQKTILGFPASKYLVDMDIEMSQPQAAQKVHMKGHMETWTVSGLPVGDVGADFLGGDSDILSSLFAMGGMTKAKGEFSKIKGFAVSNVMTMGIDADAMPAGSVSMEMQYNVVSLSQGALNPAMFRAPIDYKLVQEG